MLPHARAAHSSATVRENQLLVYGGSIGSNYKFPIIKDFYFMNVFLIKIFCKNFYDHN
jgi:hypothetical protein